MTRQDSGPSKLTQKINIPVAAGQSGPGAIVPGRCDFDIRIGRDGTWYYKGSPISRKPLVKLFSTVLRRDEKGEFWLTTPAESGRIMVDDAPFTAVELRVSGRGRDQVLAFRTNLDDWVEAGAERPIRVANAPDSGEPRPYILVRDRLEALILRPVFYELVELALDDQNEGSNQVGVWSKATFLPLGTLD